MNKQNRIFFCVVAFISIGFFSGCINNYPMASAEQKTGENISREDKIKSGIEKHLKNSFGNDVFCEIQKEGEIYELRPQEIKDLDQMIKVKNQLPLQKAKYGEALDQMIQEQEEKIRIQKELLKTHKIYPWYEQNVLFTVAYSKDSNTLYDCDFVIYPNYEIKDVHQTLKVSLNNKELSYFKYFVRQGPLFQSANDPRWANKQNEQLYKQLFTALEEEKEYKPELLKTILEIVNYVMTNNNFDENIFSKEQAKKWETQNFKFWKTLRTIEFGDLTQKISKSDGEDILTGYSIEHKFIKENESIVRSVEFVYDLNFVITSVKENLLNEE